MKRIMVLVAMSACLVMLALPAMSVAATPDPAAVASPAASAGQALVASPVPQAKWTILVYMDGDNNLEPYLIHDFDKELAAVGSNADVQVVALADRGQSPSKADGQWTGARVFHVTPGMTATEANAAADWGPMDMGSPQTLVDFVGWARANYPADHYALFFWDHGWGWWPGNSIRDDTSNDYMDVNEMRDAMQAVGGVDMVGFDTCLGQTIEVQAQFRGFARAMAGSEDSIGYTGFAYNKVLAALQADPAMGAGKLAVTAAQSMKTGHDRWTLCSSAVSLGAKWDTMVSAVSDLAWDLATKLPRYRRAYVAARRAATVPLQTYAENRDLYDIALQLRPRVRSSWIKHDCTRVIRAEREVVLYNWRAKAEGAMHGIDIYWPAAPAPPAAGASFSQWVNFLYYCTELNFTRLTYWGDFLKAWGG